MPNPLAVLSGGAGGLGISSPTSSSANIGQTSTGQFNVGGGLSGQSMTFETVLILAVIAGGVWAFMKK